MADNIEVFKDLTEQWRWRRKSENGQVVAISGEGYVNLSHAIKMAHDVNGDLPTDVVAEQGGEDA